MTDTSRKSEETSQEELLEFLRTEIGRAERRLDRITKTRPLLACGVALALGYLAGRVVSRT